jgi:hypothetical protein
MWTGLAILGMNNRAYLLDMTSPAYFQFLSNVGQVWLAKQPITTERLKKWKQQEKAGFA